MRGARIRDDYNNSLLPPGITGGIGPARGRGKLEVRVRLPSDDAVVDADVLVLDVGRRGEVDGDRPLRIVGV